MKRNIIFHILLVFFIFSCFSTAIGEYRKENVIIEFYEEPICENDRQLFSESPERLIQREQNAFLSSAEEELKREITPIYTYSHILNGMVLSLYPEEIEELKENKRIKRIREEKFYKEARAASNAESMCGADYMWSSGYEGEGMVIAIIDSECDTDHAMFTLTDDSTGAATFSDMEEKFMNLSLHAEDIHKGLTASDTYKSAKIPFAYHYGLLSSDCNHNLSTHGTHVTGIAAANNKNHYTNGVDGVAPEAQLYILSCMNEEGKLSEHTLLAALEDAYLLEPDVINCSWGVDGGVTNDDFFSSVIDRIDQSGIIVCCAMGNEGKAGKNNSYGKQTIPSSYTDYGTMSSPAAANGAVAVGACSSALTADSASLSSFSSWGTSSSLGIKPEIIAPGNAIYSTQSGNVYGTMSGTSMASPFMSGACALLLEYVKENYPSLSKTERAKFVKQLLMTSAVLIKSNGVYISPRGQGAGVVHIQNALTAPIVLYNEKQETKIELGDRLENIFDISFYAENITDEQQTFQMKGCVLNDEASYAGTVKDYVVTNTAHFPEASMLYENNQINENNIAYRGYSITLEPKEKKKITIGVSLEEFLCVQKKMIFKNGFFIEGFICLENSEGAFSIPYLGYIGDWTKGSMFDRMKYDEGKGFFGDSYLLYPYGEGFYIMGEGIYEVTEKGTAAYNAISPDENGVGDYCGIKLIMLRGAKNLDFSVEDMSGNILWELPYGSAEKTIDKDYCLTTVLWDGKNTNGQMVEEGEYLLKIEGEKDYQGDYSRESISVPLSVDVTKPELVSLDIEEIEDGTYLKIKAYDNHYLQLAQISENQYVQTQNPVKNGENTLYLPIDNIENGVNTTVTLMDYALNMTDVTFMPADGYTACFADGRLVYVQSYRAVVEGDKIWNSPSVPEEIQYDTKENFLWKSTLLPLS